MTFEEFAELPEDSKRYELRQGEPTVVPLPIHEHYLLQRRLMRLLEKSAGQSGEVCMELGYRPLPSGLFVSPTVRASFGWPTRSGVRSKYSGLTARRRCTDPASESRCFSLRETPWQWTISSIDAPLFHMLTYSIQS